MAFVSILPRMSRHPAASILGNADPASKARVVAWWDRYLAGPSSGQFGANVKPHLKIVSVDVFAQHGTDVVEIVHEAKVSEDFLNCNNVVHGGCTAFIMDICTTSVLFPFSEQRMNVSLNLDVIYHAPAPLGTRLRIVSTSVTLNARILTLSCEMYDADRGTLLATGKHIKMYPRAGDAKL
ncbi:hypothetical protein CALVIDRAFT_595635 [Calocera viscosa TUFC12733]|uniref:Thioesterase domain-containing protein n=1 Tax=Calocera viscosa (strain TUFC12733) TaxID=1330018 RepID=A0A167QUL4_CALVF|nr:hypothetical protein CALVIDRAFT_595635 [Calocera viscosa TUFC12733]